MKTMNGDPRNPKVSLLKKYDIPVEHLSYEYVEKCSCSKELENIIRILRSGEEGFYPDLLRVAEENLKSLAPESRVLRIETPIITQESLTKEEWNVVENELMSWEKEMNILDKTLDFEKSRIAVLENKNMPEIRKVSQLHQKSKSQVSDKIQGKSIKILESKNSSKRISSGDYAAWDKFDVDKELLKIDVEDEKKQEQNEKMKREAKKLEKTNKIQLVDVDKEHYSAMELEVLANQGKDRGNECFKSGDLENALKYYDISIKLHPTVKAYNNRALTYLMLKQYKNCVQDCQVVLNFEPNNVKALIRRAAAYQNMPSDETNNYDQLALQDLCKVVSLEPNHKEVQANLQKLKKKLNIEDVGKKFRMPICEEFVGKEKKGETIEKNLNQNVKEEENLPLVYYGPSTSTFRCEPYSMMHRALSGSTIPGQVLCKCNSDRPRQNPLCQRCGEAMSTPEPITAADLKKNNEIETEEQNKAKRKTVNETKKCMISKLNPVSVAQEKNSLVLETSENYDIKTSSVSKKELSLNNSEIENELKQIIENTLTAVPEVGPLENIVNSEMIKENFDEKLASDSTEFSQNKTLANVDSLDHFTSHTGIENCFSEITIIQNTKNSKSKKTKLKDHNENKAVESFKMEPVKAVHAAKWLHQTSVEPEIQKDTNADIQGKRDVSNNMQCNALEPDRKRLSPEKKIIVSSLDIKKGFVEKYHDSNSLSSEGNKENIFGSNSNSVENKIDKNETEEIKKDFIDSAYEFMKSWEGLKKFDESYVKRAEILRKLKPKDLSKVIGNKLDCETLTCLLECLSKHFAETEPEKVLELLRQLPQLPRFSLVSMFLGEDDKKKLRKMIETVEAKGFTLEENEKRNWAILS